MISQTELESRLGALLQQYKVAGAQAAVWFKGELVAIACGQANVPAEIDMTVHTSSHIGSISKVLNATLVMQLVDEGLIGLDDPVIKHVPDFTLAEPGAAEKITVRMCINHTSGIDGEIIPDQGHDQETIEQCLTRIGGLGLIHEPGEECSYSNAGCVVAGVVAQRVTGKSWYDLIRERIFEPLEMQHAVAVPEDALLHRNSVGHFLDQKTGKQQRTSHAFLPLSFAPAGSTLMMSATDLVRFGASHMPGSSLPSVLSAAGIRQMAEGRTPVRATTSGSQVGLGWLAEKDGFIWHTGGGPGIGAMLKVYPEHELAIAVLTNSEHGPVVYAPFIDPIVKELIGKVPADVAAAVEAMSSKEAVSGALLDACAGEYHTTLSRIVISRAGDKLAVQFQQKAGVYDSVSLDLSPAAPIEWICGNTFALKMPGTPPTLFEFVFGDEPSAATHLATAARLYKRQASL